VSPHRRDYDETTAKDADPQLYGGEAGLHADVHKGRAMLAAKDVTHYLVAGGLRAEPGEDHALVDDEGKAVVTHLVRKGWRHKYFDEEADKAMVVKRTDALEGGDGLAATACHAVGRKGCRVWMSRGGGGKDEGGLTDKVWSDAARQAAAAVRRAHASSGEVAHAAGEHPTRGHEEADRASNRAHDRSEDADTFSGAGEVNSGHAARFHASAAQAQREAAQAHSAVGNHQAARHHEAAASAHENVVNQIRGKPKE